MDLNQLTEDQAVILYLTSPECNVCKVIKPRVREMVAKKFPRMSIHFIDIGQYPKAAAELQVFTVPVLIVYFEGREFFRKVRNISLLELEKEISRPYNLLFDS
jgi:thioredoxin-like negative regulator of GroEL